MIGCYAEYNTSKLGHNRLRILDLRNRSNQPFISQDNKYVIVYNGEIYNYMELAKKYDIPMKTKCDTELIVNLYSKLGSQMLNLLNGMFAFVILNIEKSEVFIARDRLGIKPLYFAKEGDYITVASEIAPLLDLIGEKGFDMIGLRQYRKLRTFFGGRTPYLGISMFPAGHFMFNGKLQSYWQLEEGSQPPPEDEEIEFLIKSAVDYRCISDVEVGSYLSGGLDSTIIAALSSKPHTWTVGFEKDNEFEWSRLASERLATIHSEVLIEPQEFLSLTKEMILERKEPLSVPNEVPLLKMTREVKVENTVILSGEGADELFFGYDRIFRWAASSDWNIEEFDSLYCYGSHDDIEIVEDVLSPFNCFEKAIDRVAAFFQTDHLHGLLRRLDNSTMRCSVEARVPFVDHRLIERMAGVTINYRMENGEVKAPLKRIFHKLLPKQIVDREKIGFPVPLDMIDFGDSVEGSSSMDRWLEFNLNVLTGGSWSKQDIY